MKFLLINGPNLNRLGKREPEHYGTATLADLEAELAETARASGAELDCFQSNHEGSLIDELHRGADEGIDGAILNAGAYTHYSYALRDAIASVNYPVIEVHISNIHARESFREISVIAPVAKGQIAGLGFDGYHLALTALIKMVKGRN
ncbi:type II 3-dehydroquinate dehydratase [Bacillus sp. M6-12]|uniref:type II 3-dehydroquinate dehydratase n=1 Tax=Bacillus sp. M6-12 TaxID=2054166 RepID=UPI000C7723C5|nr:type II 3-dehydroquinate dehydratase [Bacillus sp. M6-12]PLS15292.1 type II 3-dehydroquinate dehydratase [Bacillus sp. M6-12]